MKCRVLSYNNVVQKNQNVKKNNLVIRRTISKYKIKVINILTYLHSAHST